MGRPNISWRGRGADAQRFCQQLRGNLPVWQPFSPGGGDSSGDRSAGAGLGSGPSGKRSLKSEKGEFVTRGHLRARAHAHAPAHRLSLDRLHAVQWTPLVLTLPCCTSIPNQTSQALGFTCISLPCPRGISDRIANFYERCLGFACTRAQGRVEMWGGPNACQKLEFYETDADIAPYVSCVIITD